MIAATKKAGTTLGRFLLLEMESNTVVGGGCVEPTDDADDIAWLSCMFGEMNNWHMGFLLPDECNVDLSSIKNAQHAIVPLP
jgi:hypothetical protein